VSARQISARREEGGGAAPRTGAASELVGRDAIVSFSVFFFLFFSAS